LPAILFRERLEASRACAAVDGHLIDPWRLAAELEGLRVVPLGCDVFERGASVDAAHAAFAQYQWLVKPDETQRNAIESALGWLSEHSKASGPLLGAATAFHAWVEAGHARAPMRAALIRHWRRTDILHFPLPLVGARSFVPEAPWRPSEWLPYFLNCLNEEVAAVEDRTRALEQSWRQARSKSGGQRCTSRADKVIDLLAAYPVVSATRLSAELGLSLKAAYIYLERFLEEGLIVEVTHRAARRLFALKDLEPLREIVRPPKRPQPGRKRGRPRKSESQATCPPDENVDIRPIEPAPTFAPINYEELERAIDHAERVIRRHRPD
ncbi:Fic family protein, partial [Acetobacter pasteurianus]|uniref:hypothetical protein n=1 Tax=Acetobacter pasteurianus TaxID=438 RepID=UPI000F567258